MIMRAQAMIPSRSLWWLLGSLVLVLAPHIPRQPWWVSGSFLLLAGWRSLSALRGWPLPEREREVLFLIKHALAFAAFFGVYRVYGGVFGRDAGVSLLIILLGLKLLEMRRPREYYLTVFLGFFLIITHFFYAQRISSGLYMLLAVAALIASLVTFNDPRGAVGPVRRLRLAVLTIGQAVPLMVVAFVLFPRPASPLWQLPKDARAGVSGLSEEMSPGNLSDLTLSDAVAFRVSFAAAIPAPSELYWRGPVMMTTNGRTWTPGPESDQPAPPIAAQGARYEYRVTLEPHAQRWLYVLEHPSALPAGARLSRDLRIITQRPVNERLRYSAQSYTHTTVAEANWEELRAATQLPAAVHARTKALAREWRAVLRNDAAIVQRALLYFRNQPFYYTLTPAEIQGDAVDEFLFGTRQGFCEHYAAAFTVLMRAAGVPARIVTGYQGGEYNPVGDYLIVRQRDAHAWTEVWLGRRGWVRIDPTAAVSPTRVERGIDQALSAFAGAVPSAGEEKTRMRTLWKRARYVFDTVNNRWNLWVIGYNAHRQVAFFERLGIVADRHVLVLAFFVGVSITFYLISVVALRTAVPQQDAAKRAYAQFCRKLARSGFIRAAHEGPLDFARRVINAMPQLARDVRSITELYVYARYGPSQSHDSVRALTKAIAEFSV